jgi:DNA-binding transcriptional LysR family regulator
VKNIDLKKIRHVVEVAHAESITTAAYTLSITQPALTRSIADVERQLGVLLFARMRRGMRLTEAGQVFVSQAQRVIKSVDDLLTNTQGYLNLKMGRLRIGVAPAGYEAYLNGVIATLVRTYPGIQLEIVPGSAAQLSPRVISGDLDLLWGAARPLKQWPELTHHIIQDLYCGFMIRSDHPLMQLNKIKEADLLKYPIVLPASVDSISIDISERYAPHKLPPMHPHYVTDDFELVKTLVRKTDAFAHFASLSPEVAKRQKGLVVLEGVVDLPPQQLAYALPIAKPRSPVIDVFIEILGQGVTGREKL